ncbi:MCE family protein [Mycolicibacterium smegmatis]|uniref:Virulence factor Mce family protein n=3 Tax=Mycolicibacterium smegmatis TaxID=1772 RepID=I7FQS1_MYCS2|nr:MCE family protein [Mycolicibacterium smegmatis]ABK73142.1 virulence factor mce family protein [Mycolicibacterium smegmatis MC2 155]AFP41113.1 Virulence factor Mce family protein [Mycolicibacterium smegmatis MC2 155]AIU09836.1 mammalian cell entry protein [Mycolicibacterium smegmatis MC2 155]AIU16461.1 mammalian cell entry protein [Mycolicibacterium smegmatis]AIU23084.1 mammalian cell entry protein [Mycolicibacterium smegmatis]
MRIRKRIRLAVAAGTCVALTASGCAFQGVNSLPLPGAEGRGADSVVYHVEIANVATLEPNSPVMMNDVVVGSVRRLAVRDWHADVEFSVEPGVVVPANAVATIGQTSLLGSMHLALNPPLGQEPQGRLTPGGTIPLNSASTYPTTEQTLSSLAAVVNGGGLGQIGEVIHNFSVALDGREADFRDLLTRLDNFVGTLDAQRDNIVSSIDSLNRLASTFAGQSEEITRALNKIPPAMDVLIQERPRFTTALQKLGTFGSTAHQLVNESQDDLVRNLRNLEPAIKALADVGPDLAGVLEYAGHFPFTQSFIDRAIRGDYWNLFATIDLTIPRLKRSLMLGTRWEQEGAQLVPAPGDPYYLNYTYDPLKAGVETPGPASFPPPFADPPVPAAPVDQTTLPLPEAPPGPPPAYAGPVLPVAPPAPMTLPGVPAPVTTPGDPTQIFAGPYGDQPNPPTEAPAPAQPTTGGGG